MYNNYRIQKLKMYFEDASLLARFFKSNDKNNIKKLKQVVSYDHFTRILTQIKKEQTS